MQATHAAYADKNGVANFKMAVIFKAHVKNPHGEVFFLQRSGQMQESKRNLRVRRLEFSWKNKQNISLIVA